VRPPAPATVLALSAPAPNPSRGEISLTLELPHRGDVDAAVYDVLGRRVRTIAAGPQEAGAHVLRWDGMDERGRWADPGSYFVRATSQGAIAIRRLARLR
jgi:flagellar hook assembly protein FlgD